MKVSFLLAVLLCVRVSVCSSGRVASSPQPWAVPHSQKHRLATAVPTGGCSIHPEIEFPDENFRIKHSEAGLLAMANRGRHTNTSNFYITFDECTWLNSKHVVFGTVVDGLRVLRAIEAAGTLDGTPSETVTVVDCGEL